MQPDNETETSNYFQSNTLWVIVNQNLTKISAEIKLASDKKQEAHREACIQYFLLDVEAKTKTTEDLSFSKSLLSAIFRPFGLTVSFLHQTQEFINATTIKEKLRIFVSLTKWKSMGAMDVP